MSLRLVKAMTSVEQEDEHHLGRMLVLLRSADLRKRTPESKQRAVEGITKLAKLDFVLRYPTYLERALRRIGADTKQINVTDRERFSIETKMVRFKYGPWDHRYRRWLALLNARDLVTLDIDGNTINIGLTERGRTVADFFRQDPSFNDLTRRSDVVAKTFGAMTGTKLKEFVYDSFPEIIDLKWGAEIAS